MWDGYMDYAGTEIINNQRAVAYAQLAGVSLTCEPCYGLHEALGDLEYVSPSDDDNEAPWFDRAVPESVDFLGVFGMDVSGFAVNPIERATSPLVGDGSLLGVLRRTHREVVFTVMMIARGECAFGYGMTWLASALRGGTCSAMSCWGDQLCMFACCPGYEEQDIVTDCYGNIVSGPTQYPEDDEGDLPGTSKLRHLYDVGLLEGPTLSDRQYLSGGVILGTVTFTMAASKPFIYREPLNTLTDWVSLGQGQIYGPVDPDAVYDECPQFAPCIQDPTCPDPALPPVPPVPVDPCYPQGADVFRRTFITLEPSSPPEWMEMVPVLEISTGSREMRRIIVRFWANPVGSQCGDELNPCDACFDINLSYLPQGAHLTVDGRTQRASVGCPQGEEGFVTSTPVIYGAQGGSFQWPVFTCPTAMCIEILTSADYTAESAQARVQMVPRADAA